jgi:Polyketide cyclase / dehydrase and lipid transport
VSDDRVSATRRIAASASDIFGIVTDPAKHVEIDGSHMLEGVENASPLREVGDSFIVNMDRDALGDLPLGKYTVRNVVTRVSPDRLLEWTVGGVDSAPLGHVYGYELAPAGVGETDVTLYCDWSGFNWEAVPEAVRSQVRFPVVPKMALITTLEKLDRIATQSVH